MIVLVLYWICTWVLKWCRFSEICYDSSSHFFYACGRIKWGRSRYHGCVRLGFFLNLSSKNIGTVFLRSCLAHFVLRKRRKQHNEYKLTVDQSTKNLLLTIANNTCILSGIITFFLINQLLCCLPPMPSCDNENDC
jgi:hypothetical protein